MPRKRTQPWINFGLFLQRNRGLNPNSSMTYITQVRRILRQQAETPADLEEFLSTLPVRQQTPFRTAWDSYRKFAKEQLDQEVIPCRVEVDKIPVHIRNVIKDLIDVSFLRYRDIPFLRWDHLLEMESQELDSIESPKLDSLIFIGQDDAIIPVKLKLAETLRGWAYGEKPPPDAPLVPYSPSDSRPMPVGCLRRAVASVRS